MDYILNFLNLFLQEEKLNEISSPKSAISCLRFLLINATRFNADETTFGAELQQLGLPKEHSLVLCRVLSENLPNIREKLYESRLQGIYHVMSFFYFIFNYVSNGKIRKYYFIFNFS